MKRAVIALILIICIAGVAGCVTFSRTQTCTLSGQPIPCDSPNIGMESK